MSDDRPATDSGGVPPSISEIVARYHRSGESLHRAATRSMRDGRKGVSQRRLWDLEQGKATQWPRSPEAFVALADGLETTELAVVLGFAVEFDVPVRMPEIATRIPPAADQLPPLVKDEVVRLVRALVSTYVHGAVDDEPRVADDVKPDMGEVDELIDDEGDDEGDDETGQP